MPTRSNHFLIRRLHSLTGVVPVGLFVTFHLYTNNFAQRGPEAYNALIQALRSTPFLLAVEILFIYLPILFHAIYGFVIMRDAQYNVRRYPFARNWYFLLQRVTGVILFFFIGYHAWSTTLVEHFLAVEPVSFAKMQTYVQNPWIFTWYVAGILSATFHLANGLFLFGCTWGILIGERAQRFATQALAIFFLVLSYVGINALLAFVS